MSYVVQCPECGGSGYAGILGFDDEGIPHFVPDGEAVPCYACGGNGFITREEDGSQ